MNAITAALTLAETAAQAAVKTAAPTAAPTAAELKAVAALVKAEKTAAKETADKEKARIKAEKTAAKTAESLAKVAAKEAALVAKAAVKVEPSAAECKLAAVCLESATALGFLKKSYNGGKSSVLTLPAWADFQTTLPTGEAGKTLAQTFLALREAIRTLASDEKRVTAIVHSSGSAALYSRLS